MKKLRPWQYTQPCNTRNKGHVLSLCISNDLHCIPLPSPHSRCVVCALIISPPQISCMPQLKLLASPLPHVYTVTYSYHDNNS